MKKTIGTILISVSATTFVFAEASEIKNDVQIRPNIAKMIEQKIENRLDDKGVMMTTGSSTLDVQIKALIKERDQKIKAINEEYALKLKALVGDKKILPASAIKNKMMNTSGTLMGQKFEEREDMEERRNRIMNASSTENASGTVRQDAPRKQEFKNFFRGIPGFKKFFGYDE